MCNLDIFACLCAIGYGMFPQIENRISAGLEIIARPNARYGLLFRKKGMKVHDSPAVGQILLTSVQQQLSHINFLYISKFMPVL